MIRMAQKSPATQLTKAEASSLTERIRGHIDAAWADITKAYEGKAWKALGYSSWGDYVKAEFDMSRRRSYQLIDQGRVIGAIAEAAGESVNHGTQITERVAREIKDDIPAITAEIRERVERGEDPETAASETVSTAHAEKIRQREERKAQQAEWDRQQKEFNANLPDFVRENEALKQQAIAARKRPPTPAEVDALHAEIEELREANAALEADVARLKAENKLYGEMKVQFELGGFAKVIADKDEEIRVANARTYQESADKASWMREAKRWKKRAVELGWSNNEVIEIDTGDVIGG